MELFSAVHTCMRLHIGFDAGAYAEDSFTVSAEYHTKSSMFDAGCWVRHTVSVNE